MKYYHQFEDAIEKLGIENLQMNQIADKPCVFLGLATGESITLWRALQLVMSDINICYQHILTHGLCELKWNQLVNIIHPKKPPVFSMSEREKGIIHGNSEWFKKYSENKYLSHFILDKNNISQPKQIMFRETKKMKYCEERTKRRFKELKSFLHSLPTDTEIVIKPVDGMWWNEVFFCTIEEILKLENFIYKDPECEVTEDLNPEDDNIKNEFIRCGVIFGNTLFEERIKSYPIEIDWVKKDWNLRVLTTYNTDTNSYMVSWMPWRIDNDWWAINRSISADNISLEEIWRLAWWNTTTLQKARKKVEALAIETTTVMANIWKRKNENPQISSTKDFQNLAWVDIIIDEQLEPYVIEVNDSNSGCIYESMLLDGIESIIPIAKSIKAKVNNYLDKNAAFEEILSELSKLEDKEAALRALGYEPLGEIEGTVEVEIIIK